VVSTLLFVASVTVSTYVSLATKRGTSLLVTIGLRKDVMGGVEYWTGRALAFTFICLMFFALYKYLPVRRVRAKTAWVAAAFSFGSYGPCDLLALHGDVQSRRSHRDVDGDRRRGRRCTTPR
jgi:hypothetical protein